MTDVAAPAKAAKPTYQQMIMDAIITLKDRTGNSRQAITKFIEDKYNIEVKKHMLAAALKKAEKAELITRHEKHPQSFKLGTKGKEMKKAPKKKAAPKKKPAAKKPKKAAPKKPAAKKAATTTKKTATTTKKASTTAKKAAAPKKTATAPKKAAATTKKAAAPKKTAAPKAKKA